jgi:hypothetical protein
VPDDPIFPPPPPEGFEGGSLTSDGKPVEPDGPYIVWTEVEGRWHFSNHKTLALAVEFPQPPFATRRVVTKVVRYEIVERS